MSTWVAPLEEFGRDDVAKVGGKNASLGELLRSLKERGVQVPEGFALTADAYRAFLAHNDLEKLLHDRIQAFSRGEVALRDVGNELRRAVGHGEFPPDMADTIDTAYQQLSERCGETEIDVAVRSSATAEDLPEASFAGQQETVLNVTGTEDMLDAVRHCYRSLFTDRAIAYRAQQGFGETDIALSVGVQRMVRAGRACSGVMFTLDPDSGFRDAIIVNGAWGLGEHLVGGRVVPDEWVVFKPLLDTPETLPIIDKIRGSKQSKMVYAHGEASPTKVVETRRREREAMVLTDPEVRQLAEWAKAIEELYEQPVDIEWAKDGETDELFVVQARPETVHSQRNDPVLTSYQLAEAAEAPLVRGIGVGDQIASGRVRILADHQQGDELEEGDILVTEMTDPDWVPLMARAGAIVTDRGGRTAHAAIVSRELGVPAVVGSAEATRRLTNGQTVTVSCAHGGEGRVYAGQLDWHEQEVRVDQLPDTDTKIMINLASPGAAFRWWRLPADGVGLARVEFIINDHIKVHPLALTRFDDLEDRQLRDKIEELAAGYDQLEEYYVDKLAHGIARIAASRWPDPVVVRTSDFKSNEYAELLGGRGFEPVESNPMIGWRGAARYEDEAFREAFALECRALKRVRDGMGLDNVIVMIPFCRTVGEADRVLGLLAEEGLERGDGLQVYMMCEVPSNVQLADQFAQRFDGFSIGSNDLTQLTLGVDRDADQLAHVFDERDEAVQRSIRHVIKTAHAHGVTVGLCGQGPSDHPDFAEMLVNAGIDSISLNPDAVISVRQRVAELERQRREG